MVEASRHTSERYLAEEDAKEKVKGGGTEFQVGSKGTGGGSHGVDRRKIRKMKNEKKCSCILFDKRICIKIYS